MRVACEFSQIECGGVDHTNPLKLSACGTVDWTVLIWEPKCRCTKHHSAADFLRVRSIKFNIQINKINTQINSITGADNRNCVLHKLNTLDSFRFELLWFFDWFWFSGKMDLECYNLQDQGLEGQELVDYLERMVSLAFFFCFLTVFLQNGLWTYGKQYC